MKSIGRAKSRASSVDRIIIISPNRNQNKATAVAASSPRFHVTPTANKRPTFKSKELINSQQQIMMTSTRTNIIKVATQLRPLIVIPILLLGLLQPPGLAGVSVQKLNVPDLVVIDQLNQPHSAQYQQQQQQQQQQQSRTHEHYRASQNTNLNNQPEAASLIKDLSHSNDSQPAQITFECLISFDKRRDKNLIVKWHHDDRIEPIYQWIPELNKRSIAPQYRAFIAPILTNSPSAGEAPSTPGLNQSSPGGSTQLLEAGFRLVRPSKELGGKYTCSAISSQNDDSKWKKMIVYTPPRSFRFNASRTDIEAQLASQRDRLIQLSQPAMVALGPGATPSNQLPLAYRMRGFDNPTTISSQMYSTIDYVNVNQQHSRSSSSSSSWLVGPPTSAPHLSPRLGAGQPDQSARSSSKQANGVKLVCDIDQVFPVPEVSLYRLAKLDGTHPDKLAKLDTRIERNPLTGLFHVQVISILDDDELQMKYGLNEPVYFECLIALTNLELSKYADNKRSIMYRPGLLTSSQQGVQSSEDVNYESQAGNAAHHFGPEHMNHKIFMLAMTFISYLVCYLAIQKLPFA